jgi:peptide chain release factor 2
MTILASKKSFYKNIDQLNSSLESYFQLSQEASTEDINILEKDSIKDLQSIEQGIEDLKTELQFSGEHDNFDALITISGGAGGVDAQDWASMILRMYLRWADKRKFDVDLLTTSPGEEAGIKSAMIRIRGEKAFGLLKGEKGVHRLVRLSPFNSANLRHTSFALVEVIPDFQDSTEVEINHDDLKVEAFKASGAGGQSVQKNSSAIRLTHKPSAIVVSVQNERSQSQNKNIAMQILKARLIDLEIQKNKDKENELKGEFVSAEWGNQVRSYVLHPYTLVKDVRTGYEIADVNSVLNGDLDHILLEFLKFSIKSNKVSN